MMYKVGIVAAQREEAVPLVRDLAERKFLQDPLPLDVHINLSGVGMLNAMKSTIKLITGYRPDLVVNIGVAAGRGDSRVGETYTVSRVYNGDSDISVFGHKKYYVPEVGDYIGKSFDCEGVKSLPCFSVSKFSSESMDTSIKNYMIDMEYYGIALACKEYRIPSISIKVISDTSTKDNHIEYDDNLDLCSSILSTSTINILGNISLYWDRIVKALRD